MRLNEERHKTRIPSKFDVYAGQTGRDRHTWTGASPGATSPTRNRIALFAGTVGVVTAAVIATGTGEVVPGRVGAIVVAAVAYAAGLWLLSPVTRYVDYVQRLATGDFDEEAPDTRDAQYIELSVALESMRLHLRTWMSQIARNAIEFEGSLQVLDLANVMHFLRAGKRTGTLLLQRGGETAMLFWRSGEVCGALLDGLTGIEALAIPFTWERGSFKFSPRLSPVANLDARWEVLLLNGVRGVQQPRLWSRLIPKTTTRVHRARLADHVPLRQLLTNDEWTVFTALTGELSAEDVSGRLGEPVHKIWHNLYCFAALGVIEVADDGTAFMQHVAPAKFGHPLANDRDALRRSTAEHRFGTGVVAQSPRTKQTAVGDNVIPLHNERAMRRER